MGRHARGPPSKDRHVALSTDPFEPFVPNEPPAKSLAEALRVPDARRSEIECAALHEQVMKSNGRQKVSSRWTSEIKRSARVVDPTVPTLQFEPEAPSSSAARGRCRTWTWLASSF